MQGQIKKPSRTSRYPDTGGRKSLPDKNAGGKGKDSGMQDQSAGIKRCLENNHRNQHFFDCRICPIAEAAPISQNQNFNDDRCQSFGPVQPPHIKSICGLPCATWVLTVTKTAASANQAHLQHMGVRGTLKMGCYHTPTASLR